MKILKEGATEIYDYTCEEVVEGTCPICKAVFEYTQSDCKTEVVENEFYSQQLAAYNSYFSNLSNPYFHNSYLPNSCYNIVDSYHFAPSLPVQSWAVRYIVCPCCSNKIFLFT